MKIACPRCSWEPSAGDRWACAYSHAWGTFGTGGRCPSCRTVWRDTQCLACARRSKHHDGYRDLPPVDALLEGVGAEA